MLRRACPSARGPWLQSPPSSGPRWRMASPSTEPKRRQPAPASPDSRFQRCRTFRASTSRMRAGARLRPRRHDSMRRAGQSFAESDGRRVAQDPPRLRDFGVGVANVPRARGPLGPPRVARTRRDSLGRVIDVSEVPRLLPVPKHDWAVPFEERRHETGDRLRQSARRRSLGRVSRRPTAPAMGRLAQPLARISPLQSAATETVAGSSFRPASYAADALPQSRWLASRAPSDCAFSFAHWMDGCTRRVNGP